MKIIVTLALIAVTCHASSGLKQNLKAVYTQPENQLRDVMNTQVSSKINGQAQVEDSSSKKQASVVERWLQGNGFIYLQEPFSVSPYYNFLDAFLLGLKLDTYFSYSSDCVNALVHTIDDYAYFQNNDTLKKTWEEPVMNFTKALAGNFSRSLVVCYQFSNSFWTQSVARWSLFGSNVVSYLISFLFNQMGNALSFKSIFTQIEQDEKNQYYADIAYQYGRLVRKVFDFQPTEASAFTQAFSSESSDSTVNFENEAPGLKQLSSLLGNSVHSAFMSSQAMQSISLAHNTINENLKKVGFGTFSTYMDYLLLGVGIIEGMIDVLPSNSMLAFCKNNVTLSQSTYYLISNNYTKSDTLNMVRSTETMFDVFYGIVFNCYYSAWVAINPDTYSTVFGGTTILKNILYGLGYMYTDVKNSITLATTYTEYWRKIGKYGGDLIMRVFYRKSLI